MAMAMALAMAMLIWLIKLMPVGRAVESRPTFPLLVYTVHLCFKIWW